VSVVILDYGSGNLRSAEKAFVRAADEAEVRDSIVVSADPQRVRRAQRIVLPGVGAFADCMEGLSSIDGMVDALNEAVEGGTPLLGICVGMQLLATCGLEHKTSEGLGLVPGDVVRLEPGDPHLKIPHMGWNTLDETAQHPLLEGIPLGPGGLHAYFVHSYVHIPAQERHVLAKAWHGRAFAAIVGRDNIVGTQFHPEKSQTMGLALIRNFLTWSP
jgi:glutamine amidotransferase